MIRFNTYLGKKKIFMYNKIKYLINKDIYQPELSSYIFYSGSNIEIIDPMISNKFVKRNILISALNLINDYFLNQKMIFYEDTLINFMLYKTSNSFYYLKDLGYYYISSPNSSTTIAFNQNEENINKLLYSFFLFLKFILLYTKNNKYEKDMANAIIEKEMKVILTSNMFCNINNNFIFFEKIINLYLENKFITLSIKQTFNKLKQIIKEKNIFHNFNKNLI